MTALSEYVSVLARARTAQGHTDGWIITASWNALREYLGRNPRHCDITADTLNGFSHWLVSARGLAINTAQIYVRYAKFSYRRFCAETGKQAADLSGVRCRHELTRKRALTAEQMGLLAKYEGDARLERYRDVFLLSFYLMGMRPGDLARLAPSDYDRKAQVLRYRAGKTGKRHEVPVPLPAARIIGKGLLGNIPERHAVNNGLAKLADILDMPKFTIYAARHTWASICNENGVPVTAISQGLGHSDIATTQIYLASISTEAMRRYNDMAAAIVYPQIGERPLCK